jgi:cyclomaltodextrinase / maltogenic alpha-amylase / neopullulanase
MTDQLPTSSYDAPAWVQDAIFYQIFPDRFARSSRDEKPSCLLPWAAAPTAHGYHGGDLWGIIEHLDYLVDLGINALYLTPIFQSGSNHRYHTHDYEKVDPLLGGNAALKDLVDESHQRGLRVVLDGVFNHASRGFLPFHDILENGPDSPWLEWFRIGDWPLAPYDDSRPSNYDCWLGNRALPKFNTDHPPVREYLMQIGERWVRDFDIDGWRLDVPDEITTPGFWEEFRQRVRAVKPDAYLVGEIWEDAPDWLQGDRFDATMNYQLTAAIIAFTAGDRVSPILVSNRTYDPCPAIDAVQFAGEIDRLLNLYDWQVTKSQLNLLDSHDTPRLLSLARCDKATVRLATLFQMTFPGAPCIYYGDEIGLRGTDQYDQPHEDRDARWPFPWHDRLQWDIELLTYFRQAIALRHAHPVLRHGSYHTLWTDDHCIAFARSDGTQTLIVAINAGEHAAQPQLSASACPGSGVTLDTLFGPASNQTLQTNCWNPIIPPRCGIVWQRRGSDQPK